MHLHTPTYSLWSAQGQLFHAYIHTELHTHMHTLHTYIKYRHNLYLHIYSTGIKYSSLVLQFVVSVIVVVVIVTIATDAMFSFLIALFDFNPCQRSFMAAVKLLIKLYTQTAELK